MSDDARALFKDFIERWNDGSLSKKYYSGEYSTKAPTLSNHKWGFASSLSHDDKSRLATLTHTVHDSTNPAPERYTAPAHTATVGPMLEEASDDERKHGKGLIGPAAPSRQALDSYAKALQDKDRRDLRKTDKEVHDDVQIIVKAYS